MTSSRSSPPLVAAVALATALGSCTIVGSDDASSVRIAFFQDLSVPEHVDLVSPSFLALEMVLERRTEGLPPVEIMQFDTGGDEGAAVEMATEVAADPSYVVAVAAPFWQEPPEVARILAEAGVPTLSLSPVSPSPWLREPSDRPSGDPLELWRRLVPDQAAQAAVLADLAARTNSAGEQEPVCLVNDESAYGIGLLEAIEAGLGRWPSTKVPAADAPAAVASSGCEVVVWGGFPPAARELARALREAGVARGRPLDLAGDAMKTVIPPTSPSGEGVVVGSVACPCVDVTLDLALASRRFVNSYQSEHGLTPGVYAAEGWDAGRLLAHAVEPGVTDRAAMRAAFATITAYQGVGRRYLFDATGELVRPSAGLYVASGTRWLPQPV
ncbi:MAG: ABC transporter substrate-binding protein [Actinomycetota bacterium]